MQVRLIQQSENFHVFKTAQSANEVQRKISEGAGTPTSTLKNTQGQARKAERSPYTNSIYLAHQVLATLGFAVSTYSQAQALKADKALKVSTKKYKNNQK